MAADGLAVREATPGDAPALGRLVVRTWRHAYAEILPADVLEDLDADERAGAFERLITGQDAAPTGDVATASSDPDAAPSPAPAAATLEGPTSERDRWSGLVRRADHEASPDEPAAGGTAPDAPEAPDGTDPDVPGVPEGGPARLPKILVAALAGEVVGVAAGEADGGRGAVRALYVAPHAQGAGVGRELLEALVRDLRGAGAGPLTLRVLEGAWWAQALYRSAGWHHDDTAEEADLAGAAVQRWVLDP